MRDILIFLYIFVIPWPIFFVPEAVGLKLQRVFFGHVLIPFCCVCVLCVCVVGCKGLKYDPKKDACGLMT